MRCVSTYLETYRKSHSQILRLHFDLPQNYPLSVAATIQTSIERLPAPAQDLLRLFACLDSRSIPQSIISKAAERKFHHVAVETGLPSTSVDQYADALMTTICPNGEWETFEMEKLIKACRNFSLVKLTHQKGEKFYSMHVLVKTYLQSEIMKVEGYPFSRLATRLLASAITIDGKNEGLEYNRLLLPHVRLVHFEDVTEAGDHYGFGATLEEVGDMLPAVRHLHRCHEMWRASLGDEHGHTINAMIYLAISYSEAGKEQEALELRGEILEKRRKLFGDDDLNTVSAMANFAASYLELGRDKDALPLLQEVLEKRKKLLGNNQLRTVLAMANLAASYLNLGRDKDAVPLVLEVLKVLKRVHGDLGTMLAMANPAVPYSKLGRDEDALLLKLRMRERLKKSWMLLSDNHDYGISVTVDLSASRLNLGRDKDALPLKPVKRGGWSTMMMSIPCRQWPYSLDSVFQIEVRDRRRLGP
jgi:tetratricopeptide (TPR) repeat protein